MRFNIRSAYGKCYDEDIEVLKKYNLEIIPTTPEINVSKPKEEYYITIIRQYCPFIVKHTTGLPRALKLNIE